MDVSSLLSKYVADTRFEDLSPSVVEATKKCLLDALGVTLGASGLGEGCKAFVEFAREEQGKTESTVLGFGFKASASLAAFANGSMAHALDFEDAHDVALVHPNAPTVPAALAIAEPVGASGREVLAALAIGCDLVCRLGLSLDEDLSVHGWYPPPILGAFGATAAASKLLKLDAAQVLDAFSLTLCQATCSAELKYSPHSVIRAVRDAFAAKAGVLSAVLARKGVKGFDFPFEGKAGFFKLYAHGKYDPARLIENLGRRFEGENISFKPWPTCRGTHAYIDAALELSKIHGIGTEAVESVRMVGSPLNTMLWEPLEQKQRPATAIDAKFSLPFAVATALQHKAVKLAHFTPEALRDERVLGLARKMTYEVDPNLGPKEVTQGFTEIRTADGRCYSRQVEHAYGHPKNPLTQHDLVEKFRDCASHAERTIPSENLDRAVKKILSLEDVEMMSEVIECL